MKIFKKFIILFFIIICLSFIISNFSDATDDANVIAFGEKTSLEDAKMLVETFINTPFSTEEKHLRRINKIKEYEEGKYDV